MGALFADNRGVDHAHLIGTTDRLLAKEAILSGAERQEDRFILVAAWPAPLLFHHTDDAKKQIVHLYRLINRVLIRAKERLIGRPAQHRHPSPFINVILGKIGTDDRRPITDLRVGDGGGMDINPHILVATGQGRGANKFGRHPGHIGQTRRVGQGIGVIDGQQLDILPLLGWAIFQLTGQDKEQVAPQPGKAVGDKLLHPTANRHQRDHRADADDDAQHGQHAAQLIGRQRPHGDADRFKKFHTSW